MANGREFKAAALTEVNSHILRAARDSLGDAQEEWGFFCECGHQDCHEHVKLTLGAYIALHDGGGSVLAAGHRVDQRARARQLTADAEAFVHQAEQQGESSRTF